MTNEHEFGNATVVFTRDGDAAGEFARQIHVGMVGINAPITVPAALSRREVVGQDATPYVRAQPPAPRVGRRNRTSAISADATIRNRLTAFSTGLAPSRIRPYIMIVSGESEPTSISSDSAALPRNRARSSRKAFAVPTNTDSMVTHAATITLVPTLLTSGPSAKSPVRPLPPPRNQSSVKPRHGGAG